MKSEDIAKLAGVSRSTVSRVINNYPNVPKETREKVMKVIQEHNYVPNNAARTLAGKGMNTLGLFIISINEKNNTNRIYQNNYFAPFLDIVVDRANSLDYYVLVNTVYTEADYKKIQQAFLERRIDGGIIVGTQDDTIPSLEITEKGFPMVLIDCDEKKINPESNLDNVTILNSKDEKGMEDAIKYLVKLGHKEIGMIAGRNNTYSGRVRLNAFKRGLLQYGLKEKDEYIIKGEFFKKVAYEKMRKLAKSKKLPTAFISASDDMAIAAIEALKNEGINIPGQVSIIGYDDVPISGQLKPALTTIHVPVYDMACKAVENLVQRIENIEREYQMYQFEVSLIKRETCCKK